jgi:hypothetical protein
MSPMISALLNLVGEHLCCGSITCRLGANTLVLIQLFCVVVACQDLHALEHRRSNSVFQRQRDSFGLGFLVYIYLPELEAEGNDADRAPRRRDCEACLLSFESDNGGMTSRDARLLLM